MRALTTPTLIVVGDADGVRTSHAVELFELLGGLRAGAGVCGHAVPGRLDEALDGGVVIGKVSRDHGELELPQNRLLRFAVEEEVEAVTDQLFRGSSHPPSVQVTWTDEHGMARGRRLIADLNLAAMIVAHT